MPSDTYSIAVRPLSATDVDQVELLEPPQQGFVRAMWIRQQQGESTLLVAWLDEQPVGSLEVSWRHPAELRNLNVRPHSRGRGVGTSLIEAAEAMIGPNHDVTIGVGIDNDRARALYERLGYVGTGSEVTTTYDYVDEGGIRRTATETDETLIKQL